MIVTDPFFELKVLWCVVEILNFDLSNSLI